MIFEFEIFIIGSSSRRIIMRGFSKKFGSMTFSYLEGAVVRVREAHYMLFVCGKH
jgi:hypothetical protein